MNCNLYVVTDETLSNGKTHAEISREAVAGGADMIQLRDKCMDSRALFAAAKAVAAVCKGRAAFIVNDRVDIALAVGADGVHLGQSDLPAAAVRAMVSDRFIIGVSVGSPEEAAAAVRDGADYVAVSPVFSTSSKDDAGAGLGLAMVRAIRAAIPARVPVVGIGGLNKENAAAAVRAGLDGIAVISAVVSRPDIRFAAAELAEIISEAKR
ncbi:MAG: thiamine phosphate synthase [Methanocorpusculum sp.]|nr:thiamine phosphate synthase [Methanocorpusculum sp.]